MAKTVNSNKIILSKVKAPVLATLLRGLTDVINAQIAIANEMGLGLREMLPTVDCLFDDGDLLRQLTAWLNQGQAAQSKFIDLFTAITKQQRFLLGALDQVALQVLRQVTEQSVSAFILHGRGDCGRLIADATLRYRELIMPALLDALLQQQGDSDAEL